MGHPATASSVKAGSERRLPGEEGVWIIVLSDLLVFTLFFGMVLYYRALAPESFSESGAVLTRSLGVFNTMLLLSSSLLVALAMQSVRKSLFRLAAFLLLGAILCGAGFGAIKVSEWMAKVGAGYTISSNDFFMLYYVLTGIHFLHVLIGLGLLSAMGLAAARQARNAPTPVGGRWYSLMESGGIFWHLVDLLWIVLFALFYLVP